MNECPKCGKAGMPTWNLNPLTAETARRCFYCGHIQEKAGTANASQTAPKLTPEAIHG